MLHNEKLLNYIDSLKIIVQQSIPSSNTGLEYLEQIRNIAQFYTASLFASSFIQNQIQTEGNLTTFYYRNLSSKTATFGLSRGNDLHPDYQQGANAEFLYPFYGLYARGKARYNLFPELGLEIDTSFLWNVGATYGASQKVAAGEKDVKDASALGYNIWLGLHIPVAKEVIMVLNLEYFDTGKNASPAYYNSDRYVHSGRFGVIVGLKYIFEKYNVFFDMQYATIRSYVDTKAFLGNPNYLSFEIGTEYEKI